MDSGVKDSVVHSKRFSSGLTCFRALSFILVYLRKARYISYYGRDISEPYFGNPSLV